MHVATIRRPRARLLILGSGALLTAGLLAGCGHGAAATQASTTGSSKQADALKYARCMRSHGVDIPDPQASGAGGGAFHIQIGGPGSPINPDSTTFQNAQKACQSLLPNGGQMSPQQQAQAQQNALNFSRCMRAHGVDMPDPQIGNGSIGIKITPGSGAGKINPDSPAFQSAQQACASQFGNVGGGLSVHASGPGGATGPSVHSDGSGGGGNAVMGG
jgi:hypothetical protein